MSRNESRAGEVERSRARYGLQAVLGSNLAIVAVALFGVWRLDGDPAVVVGVLTTAFTAISGVTTAYLGIKAVSNTAQNMALAGSARQARETAPAAAPPAPRAGEVAGG
ncbi:hypothetical protein ABZZ79_27575 [Streptomyces sp. NPDC006458]|uniref:hypothetical protein n=1 Tax=Streptomyces sp. NPDC006458 TaxID=3154302 RepID=UPI0033A16C19